MTRSRRGLPLERFGRIGLCVILAAAFGVRSFFAGAQSYWLDELLSVDTYGVGFNATLAQALERLARSSIHPPLYQIVLYGWMRVFGDLEAATRTLSNLYVTAAGACLYFVAERRIGVRRALFAVLLFSCMQVPFRYGLETRSYAQSLFLSALSTWALFALLQRFARLSTLRVALASGPALAVMAANFLLLMTHYFNAFFLAAQGVFALGWTLRLRSTERWGGKLKQLATIAAPLILPLVAQLAIWGPVMARTYRRRSHQFTTAVEGAVGPEDPVKAFWRYAFSKALRGLPSVLLAAIAVLAVVLVIKQLLLLRRVPRARATGRSTLIAYSLATSFGSFCVAWALFSVSSHERYVDRYFAFTAPAVAILLVLVLEQAVSPLGAFFRNRWLARSYLRWSALYALLAVCLVLPGSAEVLAKPKADWRGIARRIADLTAADPSHTYVVYATGFTWYPSLDYYFRRYGSPAKVTAVVLEEPAEKGTSELSKDRKKIEQNDYLVLAFPQVSATKFPKTLARLAKRYEVHASQLNARGEGLMVYRVKR